MRVDNPRGTNYSLTRGPKSSGFPNPLVLTGKPSRIGSASPSWASRKMLDPQTCLWNASESMRANTTRARNYPPIGSPKSSKFRIFLVLIVEIECVSPSWASRKRICPETSLWDLFESLRAITACATKWFLTRSWICPQSSNSRTVNPENDVRTSPHIFKGHRVTG